MNCSAARREATPASARNFCKRTFKVRSAERGARKTRQRAVFHSALRIPNSAIELHVRLRLAQAGDAVAVLPLAALLEEFGALEALENIALATEGGRRAQTAML